MKNIADNSCKNVDKNQKYLYNLIVTINEERKKI